MTLSDCSDFPTFSGGSSAFDLVVGYLPSEPLAIESLDTALSILPCSDAVGLASLLTDKPRAFGADYLALSIQAERRCLLNHGHTSAR